MNSFNVAELKENTFFSHQVILDKSFLLLDPAISVSKNLIQMLLEWNFSQIYSEGEVLIEQPKSETETVAVEAEKVTVQTMNIYEQMLSDVGNITKMSGSNRLAIVQSIYNEYVTYINTVYTSFVTHKVLDYSQIYKQSDGFCRFVKENRRFVLLCESSMDNDDKQFLVTHGMRSTIIAVIIGLLLNIPKEKLIELCVACILHEVGMIKLPPQTYITDKPLTPAEKKAIYTHPVISYNILKDYQFPLNVCIAALEHHEKENGEGYPRKLAGGKISFFAKVISVACSYEAITSKRQHKEAATSTAAMIELLKNSGKQYDDTVIKALLYAISLYPIGTYVVLSDKRIARVTETNPENTKYPVVEIYGKVDENGNPIIVPTSESGVRIIQVLQKQDIEKIQNVT